MYKIIVFIILNITLLISAKMHTFKWRNGLNLINYLNQHKIPRNILLDLNHNDKKLIGEIISGVKYHELIDKNGLLLQTLIPIEGELYIHIQYTSKGYKIELIPIEYRERTYIVNISLMSSIFYHLTKKIHNRYLAIEVSKILKKIINLKKIQKGDKLVVIYKQKTILGKIFLSPTIHAIFIKTKNKEYYAISYKNGFFNKKGKPIIFEYMIKPLKKIKITSPFSKRRFHPILKKWTAHLGVDFRGKVGTEIYSIADGKVIFARRNGGYGKVVKIRHKDGYMSLYAHQSKIKVKVGQRVKKGEVIGYVGNTGRSTGPHLHLGVYKNHQAINPLKRIKVRKKYLIKRDKKKFFKLRNKYVKKISKIIEEKKKSKIF